MHYLTNYLLTYGPYDDLILVYRGEYPQELIDEINRFCNIPAVAITEGTSFSSKRPANKKRVLVLLGELAWRQYVSYSNELLIIIKESNNPSFSASHLWEEMRNYVDHIRIVYLRHGKDNEIMFYDKRPENIELSVILPVYNVAPYLPQCIESLLKWDAPYVEYLFVDDGSSDESSRIIEKYAKQDSRIRLMHKENGGCASARNFGLTHSKGRYVGFVDPDDFIDPNMFDRLFHRAMDGNYDISYCGFKFFFDKSGRTEDATDNMALPYVFGTHDEKLIDMQIAFRRIAIWRAIYRKEFLDENGIGFYNDLPRFDDLPFKVETQARATSVVCVPEYLYFYRLQRPGQDVSVDDERLFVHFNIFQKLDRFFETSRSASQLEYYAIVKLDTHAWALSNIRDDLRQDYLKRAKEDMLKTASQEELRNIVRNNCNQKQRKVLEQILSV